MITKQQLLELCIRAKTLAVRRGTADYSGASSVYTATISDTVGGDLVVKFTKGKRNRDFPWVDIYVRRMEASGLQNHKIASAYKGYIERKPQDPGQARARHSVPTRAWHPYCKEGSEPAALRALDVLRRAMVLDILADI